LSSSPIASAIPLKSALSIAFIAVTASIAFSLAEFCSHKPALQAELI
jgi:hypothetical protein